MGLFFADHFSAASHPPPQQPPTHITQSDILEIKSRPNPNLHLMLSINAALHKEAYRVHMAEKKKKRKKDNSTATC